MFKLRFCKFEILWRMEQGMLHTFTVIVLLMIAKRVRVKHSPNNFLQGDH